MVYLLSSPAQFEARTRLLIRNGRPPVVAAATDVAAPIPAPVSDAQITTEVELLSADPILRNIALVAFGHRIGNAEEPATARLLERIRKSLKVSPVLRTDLVEVKYTDSDRSRAIVVLRVLTGEYLNRQLELRGGRESREFFSKRVNEFQKEVEDAQAGLARFQAESGAVAVKEQQWEGIKRLAGLLAAANEADAQAADLEKRAGLLRAQIGEAPARIGTTLRAVPNQYSVERLNTLLVELRNKRTELRMKFQPADRAVRQVEEQINQTAAALDQASGRISKEETSDVNPQRQQAEMELARVEQARVGVKARAYELARQVASLQAGLRRVTLAGPREAVLMQRVRDAELNYALYSRKRDQLRVEGLMDDQRMANAAVVEPPDAPVLPKPKITPTVVALFTLAQGSMLLLVLLGALLDRTVSLPVQLERFTRLPVLATLARSAPRSRRQALGQGNYLEPLVQTVMAKSAKHGPRTIFFVVSVDPEDYTPAVARSVAAQLTAESPEPVLLVSGHNSGCAPVPGSTEEMVVVESGDGVRTVVSKDDLDTELGSSGKVWLGVRLDEFSAIIVDSGPVAWTESLPLVLREGQGIFLCVTSDKSNHCSVARALRLLRNAGCEASGFILHNRTYPIPQFVFQHL